MSLQEEKEDLEEEQIKKMLEEEEKKEGTEEEKPQEEKKRKLISYVIEWGIYIAIVLCGIFLVPKYVMQRTLVSGSSMENTLHNGESLLVEKVSYHFTDPKRFDIVIFYPHGNQLDQDMIDQDTGEKEYFVKRVIGLPGETIQIIGPDIYIDGKKLEEHYGKDPITYAGIAEEPLTLGEDEFFVMGDNREVSYDSRYDDIGPVRKEMIESKAILRIWPLSEFGTID